jgi:hypothetical protein
VAKESVMNAYVVSNPGTVPPQRHRPNSLAAWIALAVSPIVFAIVMEVGEAMAMNGWFTIDAANTYIAPLTLLIPLTVVGLGVRAIRRGASGHPWVPTVIGGLLTALLAVALLVELLA